MLREWSDYPTDENPPLWRRPIPGKERAPELSAKLSRARRTVTLINGLTLTLIIGLSIALWHRSGELHYLAAVLFAIWCLAVEFGLRQTMTARERWDNRRAWKSASIGLLSALIVLSALAWPLAGWFLASRP